MALGFAGECRPPDCSVMSNNAAPRVHINKFKAKLRRPVNLSIIMADTVPTEVRTENIPNKVLPLAEKLKRKWLRAVAMTINKKVLSNVLITNWSRYFWILVDPGLRGSHGSINAFLREARLLVIGIHFLA